MKVIFFNAPRRSGKDTATNELTHHLRTSHTNEIMAVPFKFDDPLRRASHALFGLHNVDPMQFEETKMEANETLFGHAPCEIYKKLSEDFAKKQFGQDFFGQLVVRAMRETESRRPEGNTKEVVAICSDAEAIHPIMAVLSYVGTDNALIIQIERKGAAYAEGDTGYLEIPGVKSIRMQNNKGLHHLKFDVIETAMDWIHGGKISAAKEKWSKKQAARAKAAKATVKKPTKSAGAK